jgi:hypothetical protein
LYLAIGRYRAVLVRVLCLSEQIRTRTAGNRSSRSRKSVLIYVSRVGAGLIQQ